MDDMDENGRTHLPQDGRSAEPVMSGMGAPAIFSPTRLRPSQIEAANIIVVTADSYGLAPAFMVALAVTESSLRPGVIGDDGRSIGLFQLQLSTARLYAADVTDEQLVSPTINATLACRHMRNLFRNFPGHAYGDYAEAWTLGGRGRFVENRRNLQKWDSMRKASVDLELSIDLTRGPA